MSVPTRVADQIEAAQESMKNARKILLALVQDPQITKNLQSVLEQLYSELDEKAAPIMAGFADLLDTEVNVYAEGRAQRKNKMKITKRQLRRIIREFVDMPTQEREWLDQMGAPRQVLDQAAGPSLKPEVEEDENTILMGYRGSNFLETGAVYAPYVPLIMTPLVYDPNDFPFSPF